MNVSQAKYSYTIIVLSTQTQHYIQAELQLTTDFLILYSSKSVILIYQPPLLIFITMHASDDDDNDLELIQPSHDDTGLTFNSGDDEEHDYEMVELSDYLLIFFESELINKIKLDDLDLTEIIQKYNPCLVNPRPLLYFLPYTIILPKQVKLSSLRDAIVELQRKPQSTGHNYDRQQIDLKIHNQAEMVFYKIRKIHTDRNLHTHMDMLDPKCLVTRLYDYYERYYEKLYFKETTGFILYWAYQKGLLIENYLNEEIIKMITICAFLNFGYGVKNIVYSKSKDETFKKKIQKMDSYCKIDSKGVTKIDLQLASRYKQYSIEQKKGFYRTISKSFMKIKDLLPVYFPLLPMEQKQDLEHQKQIDLKIKEVLSNEKQKMSLCKNIYRIFKFLHNKFNKPAKLVIDLEQRLGYKDEFAESIELEVIHPVFRYDMTKSIEKSTLRRIRSEIQNVYQSFKSHQDPSVTFKFMFTKN